MFKYFCFSIRFNQVRVIKFLSDINNLSNRIHLTMQFVHQYLLVPIGLVISTRKMTQIIVAFLQQNQLNLIQQNF